MSIGDPTGKPATSLPPEMQSSMAISSATRIGGLYSATESPSTTRLASGQLRASEEAMRFGLGISP